MKDALRFKRVENREEFDALAVFAASFGHMINDGTRLPIVMVYRGKKLIAYYQVVAVPMFAPSFHTDPAICSHRDTLDIISAVKNHAFLDSLGGRTPNGECLVLTPDPPAPGFTDKVMEKLGFTDLKQKVYQAIG